MFKYSLLACLFSLQIMANQVTAAQVDPTSPFGQSGQARATPDGKALVLESIVHGEGIHTVVISGKVLKTFDYIGEYQLTAVNDQSVILRSKTKRLKLTIFKRDIVKTHVAK